jgi:phosphoribosylaminoimidazolecarboxamide formyltransferase/IMP cyclohydrolase
MAVAMPDGKARFDGVIAPGFEDGAIQILSRAKGKCRLIKNTALLDFGSAILDTAQRFRYVRGGFLPQPNYTFVLDFNSPEMKVFGKRDLAVEENLLIAWGIGCASNSNTITIVNDVMLIGNGVGQQDRVGAAELAIKRAIDAGHKEMLEGAVAYSDSFFPFPDAVQVLIDAGIRAIFSTSGSVNDQAIQELCMKNGVTLYQLPDSQARGFFGH